MKISNFTTKFAAVVLLISWCTVSFAWADDFRLEVKIYNEFGEEFVFSFDLSASQAVQFQNDPYKEIQSYLMAIRRECALRSGYTEEKCGPEFYRMVIIENYKFTLMNATTGRVVVKK